MADVSGSVRAGVLPHPVDDSSSASSDGCRACMSSLCARSSDHPDARRRMSGWLSAKQKNNGGKKKRKNEHFFFFPAAEAVAIPFVRPLGQRRSPMGGQGNRNTQGARGHVCEDDE